MAALHQDTPGLCLFYRQTPFRPIWPLEPPWQLLFHPVTLTHTISIKIFCPWRALSEDFLLPLLLFFDRSWSVLCKRFAHISHSAVLVERHFLERYWFSHTSTGYIRVGSVGRQAAQWEMGVRRTQPDWHRQITAPFSVAPYFICLAQNPRYHGLIPWLPSVSCIQLRWTEPLIGVETSQWSHVTFSGKHGRKCVHVRVRCVCVVGVD